MNTDGSVCAGEEKKKKCERFDIALEYQAIGDLIFDLINGRQKNAAVIYLRWISTLAAAKI